MKMKKERIKRICATCGIEFQLLACQLKRGRGQYCSKACAHGGMQRGTTLHCALCDTQFYRSKAEQDLGIRVNQFCSRDCYMEWRAINRGNTYPKTGKVHEHRIVASAVLKRPLQPGEVVHHIDLVKTNNHPSNLAVFPSQSIHARCHFGGMSDEELHGYKIEYGCPALNRSVRDIPQE
jgi:hypothetical protein